jgi:NitT/TauT family transport system ATP-binding protein
MSDLPSPALELSGTERPAIQVRALTKSFDLEGKKLCVVDHVSFAVRKGEFVALLGSSGCGKSTILNMIAGLIPITSGEATVGGVPVQFGKVRAGVGYVLQRDAVFPWRTVLRNIGYGLELAGVSKAVREARVREVIHRAGLDGFENAFPLMLSGGMRQRVGLMRSLIMQPEILLMDEPFGALDFHTKLEMHRFLLDIWERERQTVMFVTHDLSEALTLADRIIVLTARPGRVKEVFEVPFARPRDAIALRETREFGDLFAAVWHSVGTEFARGRDG